MKFILWLLVAALVVAWLMRPKKQAPSPRAPARMPGWQAPAEEAGSVESMVRCQACGTYVPASEALGQFPAVYCCDEHRRQHQPDR